ncbi:MAG: polyketide cyclase / dehydrase and lipid transport [halophilic archaeon J07HB67]|jgi:Polyketide cyclase / dehydrase and lipid transport.|nr:MAG: polyketide cyclase / dehydrase and lipid transport [halophilic archaeon J07HB67]
MEVAESAVIDAPRAAVVAVVDDPQTQVRVTPALTGIADVRPKPDGGRRMVYGYGVFGLVFTGVLETTTYDPPDRIVFEMTGDLAGEIRWTFESVADGQTRFTYAARYDLSQFPLGGLFRPVVRWFNRRELRRAVENTRRLAETDHETTASGDRVGPHPT